MGVEAHGFSTDMGNASEVENLVTNILKTIGHIDIWVNNAGVMASGKLEEIPMEIHHGVIHTNLLGYLHGTYYILPVMKAQQHGIIINNVSIGGFMPAPYSAVYSATKAGIKKMMECLQGEISDEPHIHICNVYPQIQRSTGNMHSAKYSGLDFKIPPFASDPKNTAQKMVNLAISPKKDVFPTKRAWLIKTIYSLFPKTVINGASAAMRLSMKLKNGEPTGGNVLHPSTPPHQIYGETALPVPSEKTKKGILIGLGLLTAYMILKPKNQ